MPVSQFFSALDLVMHASVIHSHISLKSGQRSVFISRGVLGVTSPICLQQQERMHAFCFSCGSEALCCAPGDTGRPFAAPQEVSGVTLFAVT